MCEDSSHEPEKVVRWSYRIYGRLTKPMPLKNTEIRGVELGT
jgi:hypothetical protein